MKIVLLNPPHTAIGSRIPDDHLPPLGLLAVGGPLIDDGHEVRLIDCEFGPLSFAQILERVLAHRPELVLIGHSGSTSAHPTASRIAREIKAAMPSVRIVYGGVFPTYHWRDVLSETDVFDYIVRGEGEESVRRLVRALSSSGSFSDVPGIAYREDDGVPVATRPAEAIADLDAYRIGWELIDHQDYSYWGGKRAVVLQFSRGCPHLCNYCGQRGFWTRWRHRAPVAFAKEIARVHREQGVELINLADENPTSSPKAWIAFLNAMIAENVPVQIVGSTRADDIVRDADILHLYRKAGVVLWLLGMENTDDATLKLIKKGGTVTSDRQALALLRKHDILSMATWVVGFEEERLSDLWRGFRQLLSYDPDQIQALYVTPHRWTPFFGLAKGRTVIEPDIRKWDYKHQVLKTKHLHPVVLFCCVKLIEVAIQVRPKALTRIFLHRDRQQRHAMRWYTRMGRRVWFHELYEFMFRRRHLDAGPSLQAFWGAPQEAEEESMLPPHRRRPNKMAAA